MRICFFAGADSLHSHRWIKYFHKQGHLISWISLRPSEEIIPEGIDFYEIGPLSSNPLILVRQVFQLRRILSSISPDLFHVHSVGTYGLISALADFHPLVATAWGSDVLIAGKSFLKRPFVKYVLRKADLITCDAFHMVDAIADLGISADKIRLVYFGVEPDKFCPGEKATELLRLWGADGAPTVISLRSLEPIYDIETLIMAIPAVLAKIPEVKFIIAGAGSQERYLRVLVDTLGVNSQVRFIGRYLHAALPDYLRASDVYVSTSLSDAGIAASTAEAMSTSIPVVVTDSGENGRWVIDGQNGMLFPVRRPGLLAEKIIFLLENRERRDQIAIAGRKTIETKNNYYSEMMKMDEIYQQMSPQKRLSH